MNAPGPHALACRQRFACFELPGADPYDGHGILGQVLLWFMKKSEVLVLFTKLPRPGSVKTRLCPPLRAEQAAGLQAAFLEDAAAQARRAMQLRPGLAACLAVTPFEGSEELRRHRLPLLPQEGTGLGARMTAAMARAFAAGASRVLLRGTDSPLLPLARLREGFDALAAPGVDVLLGPDHGGGYYLVGLRRPLPELFAELPLGSASEGATIFERSLARTEELGLSCALLRQDLDVDLPEDLERLAASLREHPEAAPATAAFLDSMGLLRP
ncbi:MAG: hypothetical protein CSA62_14940 [Planctomycetota bacterium]|nr:MAG: hypothetical protein CSA62_14940 [Planctomycetota bacterium]